MYVFFRLDETDAFYVDVIHTDANPLMSAGLGMWQTCGHLDFYPNGGRIMAGGEKGIMDHIAEVRKIADSHNVDLTKFVVYIFRKKEIWPLHSEEH